MRNRFFYVALAGFACAQNTLALEQYTNTTPNTTQAINQQPLDTRSVNSSDVQKETIREQAQRWGLTDTEWQHYLEIKNHERSYWSPNLDPITMLGVEADTEAERYHYAELLAKKEYARAEKELAFQRAYDRAFQQLYPNQQPFTVEPHISQAIGRIYYFTRLDNCPKCETDINRILNYANDKTPIDIYVVGSQGHDEAIRAWASKHHIDPVKVKNRQITLNHDSGYWLMNAKGKMPVAFEVQGDGQWKSIAY